jgi:hypothetical protein
LTDALYRATVAMLTTYMELKVEGRPSGIQIVEEASIIYRGLFDQHHINKAPVSEHYINSDFIITMYDGARMSNNTLAAFDKGRDQEVERNGLTCLLACQTSNVIACVSQNHDESGIYPRMLFHFAKRRKFLSKSAQYRPNEEMKHTIKTLYKTNTVQENKETDDIKTDMLNPNVASFEQVEFDVPDIIFALWNRHCYEVQYVLAGDAYNIVCEYIQFCEEYSEEDYNNRHMNKGLGKIMRLVAALHPIVYIFDNCKSKDELCMVQIPREITSAVVAKTAFNMLYNSWLCYDACYKWREAMNMENHMQFVRKFLACRVTKNPFRPYTIRELIRNFKFITEDVHQGLFWLQANGWGKLNGIKQSQTFEYAESISIEIVKMTSKKVYVSMFRLQKKVIYQFIVGKRSHAP